MTQESTPPASQSDEALVELACSLWRADAERAAPNVAKMRTLEAFAELSDRDREVWLFSARAILPILERERAAGTMIAYQQGYDHAAEKYSQAMAQKVAAARAEGKREGIEEAAKVAEDDAAEVYPTDNVNRRHLQACREIADKIRALAEKQP